MNNIFDYTLSHLEEYLLSIHQAKFVAKQIYEWIYQKRIFNFNEMTNLSKKLREKLNNDFNIEFLTIKKVLKDKYTSKYLFQLKDNNLIEAVLMKHDYGNSICVSSQVGCNMGCSFCESGRLKRIRNLTSGEIVRQILMIEDKEKIRISSVVVMGIGEPFDNYDNIINFISIINNPNGLAIGARHITVSTCGIVPKIKEYAHNGLQTNLAISLHAPNDELRSKLMKINKVYKINELIEAISYYIEETNRRVTIEYVMLEYINDSKKCSIELANLLKGLNVYVNLIPYNETSHLEFKKSSQDRIDIFYDTLKKHGINVTVRKEFGRKIKGACGQLRASEVDK